MVEFVPISEVKNMRSGVNTKGEVKGKGSPRTVNLKAGGTIDVCDATLADGPGEENQINLTLWGEDISKVDVGAQVEIHDGYTNEFKGTVSVTKGRSGKMFVNGTPV